MGRPDTLNKPIIKKLLKRIRHVKINTKNTGVEHTDVAIITQWRVKNATYEGIFLAKQNMLLIMLLKCLQNLKKVNQHFIPVHS